MLSNILCFIITVGNIRTRSRQHRTWMVSLRTSMKLSVMTRWMEIWKKRRNCLTLNLWLVAVEITSEVHIYGIVPITAVVGRIYK